MPQQLTPNQLNLLVQRRDELPPQWQATVDKLAKANNKPRVDRTKAFGELSSALASGDVARRDHVLTNVFGEIAGIEGADTKRLAKTWGFDNEEEFAAYGTQFLEPYSRTDVITPEERSGALKEARNSPTYWDGLKIDLAGQLPGGMRPEQRSAELSDKRANAKSLELSMKHFAQTTDVLRRQLSPKTSRAIENISMGREVDTKVDAFLALSKDLTEEEFGAAYQYMTLHIPQIDQKKWRSSFMRGVESMGRSMKTAMELELQSAASVADPQGLYRAIQLDSGEYFDENGYKSEEARSALRERLIQVEASRQISQQALSKPQVGMGPSTVRAPSKAEVEGVVDSILDKAPELYRQGAAADEDFLNRKKYQDAFRQQVEKSGNFLGDTFNEFLEMAPHTLAVGALGSVGMAPAALLLSYSQIQPDMEIRYRQAGMTADGAHLYSKLAAPIAVSLDYVGAMAATRGTGAVLRKQFAAGMKKNLVPIMGTILKTKGADYVEEVLTEGGQKLVEDIILVYADRYAHIDGLSTGELFDEVADETIAAARSMWWMTAGPGIRDTAVATAATALEWKNPVKWYTNLQSETLQRRIEAKEQADESEPFFVPDTEGETWAVAPGAAVRYLNAKTDEERAAIVQEVTGSNEGMSEGQAQEVLTNIEENGAEFAATYEGRVNAILEEMGARTMDDGTPAGRKRGEGVSAAIEDVLIRLQRRFAAGKDVKMRTHATVEEALNDPDIDEQTKEALRRGDRVQAFESKGNVVFITENLDSRGEAISKFAHEILGHGSIKDLDSDASIDAFLAVLDGVGIRENWIKQWYDMLTGVSALYKAQFAKKIGGVYVDENGNEVAGPNEAAMDERAVADEILARISEKMMNEEALDIEEQTVAEKMRDWLWRSIGAQTAAEWSNQEIGTIVRNLMRGDVDAEQQRDQRGTRFSDIGSGRGFTDFFGRFHGAKGDEWFYPTGDYEPAITLEQDAEDFQNTRGKFMGNFDLHIATSIPGFSDLQAIVGDALVKAYGEQGARVLDIGASEGALVKAMAELSGGRITSIALDPNPEMKEAFDEKGQVEGVEYRLEALGNDSERGQFGWIERVKKTAHGIPYNGPPHTINFFDPGDEKFDVVHEAMVFQFMSNQRAAQLDIVKSMMADDGVVILEEKFTQADNDQYNANEKKNAAEWKSKYYTEEQIERKRLEILSKGGDGIEGMTKNQIAVEEMHEILADRFKHFAQFWDSGNFMGFIASDSKAALQKVLDEMQSTETDFSNNPVGEVYSASRYSVGDVRAAQAVNELQVLGVPLRTDGKLQLTHWSPVAGLSSLEPSSFGTGPVFGVERKRSGEGFVDRVQFGLAGYQREVDPGHRYNATVEPGELYPLLRDPLNLKEQARPRLGRRGDGTPILGDGVDLNRYEQLIQEAGYKGFISESTFGPVAALFESVPVESVIENDTSSYAPVEVGADGQDALRSWSYLQNLGYIGGLVFRRAGSPMVDTEGRGVRYSVDSLAARFRSNEIYGILLNAPSIQSGPFDGGCLVCAKALARVIPGAEVVTMINPRGEPDHYGVKLPDGAYGDADGYAESAEEWAARFKNKENLDFTPEVVDELVPSDSIPDDASVVDTLVRALQSPRYSVAPRKVDALGFYSPIRAEVDAMDFKQIPPRQLADRIRKLPKQEEMEDLGLYDWLELQEGKVSKESVLAFIDQGGVQLNQIINSDEQIEANTPEFSFGSQIQDEHDMDFMREVAEEKLDQYIEDNDLQDDLDDGVITREQVLEQAAEYEARSRDEDLGTSQDMEVTVGDKTFGFQWVWSPLGGNELYSKDFQVSIVEFGEEGFMDQPIVQAKIREFLEEKGEIQDTEEMEPQYGSYVMEGPLTNYREFILTLPTTATTEQMIGGGGNDFTHSHWSGVVNPLVHFRTTDRKVDGKPTLFLEEIQSDWIQQGRKKGYSGQPIFQIVGLDFLTESFNTREAAQARIDELGDTGSLAIQETERRTGVPDPGAFKRSGTVDLLAFKRALAIAVAEGYDNIAWTPAIEQIRRWSDSLQQEVNSIAWENDPRVHSSEVANIERTMASRQETLDETRKEYDRVNAEQNAVRDERERAFQEGRSTASYNTDYARLGESSQALYTTINRLETGINENRRTLEQLKKNPRSVQIERTNGQTFTLYFGEDGVVTEQQGASSEFIGKTLAEIFDASIAKQILGEESGSLEGDGLTIGGKGFKDFYDGVLPKAVQKYVKKMGGRVGVGKAVTTESGGRRLQTIEGFNVRDSEDYIITQDPVSQEEAERMVAANEEQGFYMEPAGQVSVKVEGPAIQEEVWNVEITDQMRDEVSMGQPRYSIRNGGQEGEILESVSIDEDKWQINSDTRYSFGSILGVDEPPFIELSDLNGLEKFVFASDRTRVGPYVPIHPDSNINITLQGGPGYPFDEANKNSAAWAVSGGHIATMMAARQGQMGLITLFNRENAIKNPTFAKVYIAEVREAIERGELSKTRFLRVANQLRVGAKRTAMFKDAGASVESWKRQWTSLEDVESALRGSRFDIRGNLFFQHQPGKKGSNKFAKIGRDDLIAAGFPDLAKILDGFVEPAFDALPTGTAVGAVEIGGVPISAADHGIPHHDSYGLVVPGRGVGLFRNPVHIEEVVDDERGRRGWDLVRTHTMRMSPANDRYSVEPDMVNKVWEKISDPNRYEGFTYDLNADAFIEIGERKTHSVAFADTQGRTGKEGLAHAIGHAMTKGEGIIGGWRDPKTGTHYIDSVRLIDDESEARKFKEEQKQVAMFDLGTGEERYSIAEQRDPLTEATVDLALRILEGKNLNRRQAEMVIKRYYPGADPTTAVFRAHKLAAEIQPEWSEIEDSSDRAIQRVRSAEAVLGYGERAQEAYNSVSSEFKAKYLQGRLDQNLATSATRRGEQALAREKSMKTSDLDDQGLLINDPVAQLDVKEELKQVIERKQKEEDESGEEQEQNPEVTDEEIETAVAPKAIPEYLASLKKAVAKHSGFQQGSKEFLVVYRQSLLNALDSSIRALTYGRTRESLLRHLRQLEGMATEQGLDRRAASILWNAFQQGARDGRKEAVSKFQKVFRRRLKNKTRNKTGSWTRDSLDKTKARLFRFMLDVSMMKPDEVREMQEDLQTELDNGLEKFYALEKDKRGLVADEIADLQMKLELLDRYGALPYKTLAQINEATDTALNDLDAAFEEQKRRIDERKDIIQARKDMIIDALMSAKGKLKRTDLSEKIEANLSVYPMSLHSLLQDMIRFASPKLHSKLWNDDVRAEGQVWSLKLLSRQILTKQARIRERKRQVHQELIGAIQNIYGIKGRLRAQAKLVQLMKANENYRKYSKHKNPIALSQADLMQMIAYLEQDFYADNAERHGRMQDYQAMRDELSEQDYALLEWMRSFYQGTRQELSDQKRKLTGLGFPVEMDENYMPVSIQQYGSFRGVNTSLQLTPGIYADRRHHTKDITEGQDIFSLFFDRNHKNAVYLELAELSLDIAEIFGDADLQQAMSEVYGERYTRHILRMLFDTMSQKPLRYGTDGATNVLLNYGALVMTFNLASASRQPASAWEFGLDLKDLNMSKGELKALKTRAGKNKLLPFIVEIFRSEHAAARFDAGQSYEIAAAFESEGMSALKTWVGRWGMAPNKMMDLVTISTFGARTYRLYYQRMLDMGMDETQAREAALEWTWAETETHQQSGLISNQAPWQRSGDALQKLAGMFSSTPQQFLSIQNQLYRQAKATGNWKPFIRSAIIHHVLGPGTYKLIDTMFQLALGRPPDEDEWKEWMAFMVLGPYSGGFVYRMILAYGIDKIIGNKSGVFGIDLIPAERGIEVMGDMIDMLKALLIEGDVDKAAGEADRVLSTFQPYNYASTIKENYIDQ